MVDYNDQRRRNDSPAREFINYQKLPQECFPDHLIEVNDGPLVTDGPHLVAFSLVSVLTILIGLWAFLHGRPATLMAHSNFEGKYCGLDDPYRAMPYTYYPLSPHGKRPKLMTCNAQCVTQCPSIDDVGKALPILMTQEERDSLNPASGSLYIQYNVRTPMYATELQLGICIPKDPALNKSLFEHLASTTSATRQSMASLSRAYPLMIYNMLASGVLFFTVIAGLLPTIPRITQYLVVIGSVTSALSFGLQLIYWSIWQIHKLPSMYLEAMPVLQFWGTALGLGFTVFGLSWVLLSSANWAVITDGISIFKAYGDVFRSLQAVFVAPMLLSGLAITSILLGVYTTQNLVSMSHVRTIAPMEVAIPFTYRVTEFPLGARVGLVVFLIGLLWILYLLRTIARYCGAYTAVVWYFCDECDHLSRNVHFIEAMRSLQMAWTMSLGSNVFFALLMPICNGIRYCYAFASRRRSPHFTQPDNDDLCETFTTSTPTESLLAAQLMAKYMAPVLPTFAAVCDFFTNAALAEIILVAREFLPAMAYAKRRLVRAGPLVRAISVGRFIGSFDVFAFQVKVFFSMTTMILTFGQLSAEPVVNLSASTSTQGEGYTMPNSSMYVANPILATLIVGFVFYIIADITLGFYEGIIDTISYCYTIDVQGGDVLSPSHAGGPLYEERPCMVPRAPKDLVKLLTALLENEVGIVFQESPDIMRDYGYELHPMHY